MSKSTSAGRFGWKWVLSPVALLLLLATPSTSSAQSMMSVWRDLYTGCAEDPDHRQLCACVATEFIQRCLSSGNTSPYQVAQCTARNQATWLDPTIDMCHEFGALRVAGPVATPTARPVTGRGGNRSQDSLWNSAFQACEPNMSAGAHHDYACACVATYTVQACAATGPVPSAHASACTRAIREDVATASTQCMTFGALATRAPAAAASGEEAPPATGTATPGPTGAGAAAEPQWSDGAAPDDHPAASAMCTMDQPVW